MESTVKKIKLEKGKNYYFICYSLVSGGKSTLFESMISNIKDDPDYNYILVSSDQVRDELAKKLNEKEKDKTYKQCFELVGKNTAKEFDRRIENFVKNSDKDKINIILVDKNYPQGINKFLSKFCQNKELNYIIVLLPNITNPIKSSKYYYPYSVDYIIQCYLRLKHRVGHENLNGDDEDSKYIYLSFLKLFNKFRFETGINTDDQYVDNVFYKAISFTDESNNFSFEGEFEKFFSKTMGKIKAFDIESMKNHHGEQIESFFKFIEDNYDNKNLFMDTREKIKEETKDILINGI